MAREQRQEELKNYDQFSMPSADIRRASDSYDASQIAAAAIQDIENENVYVRRGFDTEGGKACLMDREMFADFVRNVREAVKDLRILAWDPPHFHEATLPHAPPFPGVMDVYAVAKKVKFEAKS